MQNLTRRSNWQYAVSRKIVCSFFKRTFGTSISSLNCKSLTSTRDSQRLLLAPVSYQAYKRLRREFHFLQTLLQQSGTNVVLKFLRPSGVRNFSGSAVRANNEQNKSSEGSSEGDGPKKDPEKDKKENELRIIIIKLLLMSMLSWWIIQGLVSSNDSLDEAMNVVSWNEFAYHMLAKGEVKEVIILPYADKVLVTLHPGAVIKGRQYRGDKCMINVSDIQHVEEKIRALERNLGIRADDSIPVIYNRNIDALKVIVFVGLAVLVLSYLLHAMNVVKHNIKYLDMSQLRKAKFTLIDPMTKPGRGVRFEDVAGLKEAKTEVMEFVDYLKHPERYRVLGAKIPKGALLLGPPGCGKTLLAKAVANEANVPFLSMNGSEFIEMFGGMGAARVRDLFAEGKKRAPSIIYIDEIDCIGKKRSGVVTEGGGSSEDDRTLNQLLVEMDGMVSKEDVIVLGSTNRADVLDKALLRPGRFDRHILIDLPTLEERKQIFEQYLKTVTLQGKPEQYSGYLAYLTPGFSGADIANICNEAALAAARDGKKVIESSDLMYAVDRVIGGAVKKSGTLTPSMKRVVAYHEAGHALIAWLLEHTDALLKVTIVPRTNMTLGFAQYTPADRKLHTSEQIFEFMCVMLGGRVAENLIFGQVSVGAENDLKKVTKAAYKQVQQYGMSKTVGLLSFDEFTTSMSSKKPYSRKLGNLMDLEVRRLVTEAYRKTEEVLAANKDKLELLAEELLKKETLSYNDVEKLLGPPPFGTKRLMEPSEFEKIITDMGPVTEEKTAPT